MNAFDDARRIEAEGMRYLLPFFREMSYHDQVVVIAKGTLAEKLQQEYGDIFLNRKRDESIVSVELKIEERNKHGNFFLETYSNKSRDKPGWMRNGLSASWLGYFFLREQDLYLMALEQLRRWAFHTPSQTGVTCRIEDFEEKVQTKRDQMNDTWGRCVPITILRQEVKMLYYHVNHNQLTFRW